MKRNSMFTQPVLSLFTLLVVFSMLAGCNLPASSGSGSVSTWIDVPLDGLIFPSVQAIKVSGHAASPGGVSRIEIWINGALLATINDPPMEGELALFHTEWAPTAPGEYVIQAQAFATDGTASEPDSARVTFGAPTPISGCPTPVGGGPTPVSCAPVGSGCPTPVGGGPTPVSCALEVSGCPTPVGGGPTPVTCGPVGSGCPTPVGGGPTPVTCGPVGSGCPTPVGGGPTPVSCDAPVIPLAPVIEFLADPAEVPAGGCSTIRWHVENVQRVVFGGTDQPFDGSYDDCFCENKVFPLRVTHLDGSEEKRTVEIAVSGSCNTPTPPPPPEDTTPPPVPAPAVPADGLTIACKGSQSLVWLPVDDPSGIAEYHVEVQRHGGDNNWSAAPGGKITVADKTTSVPVECGWYYRWRVQAMDGKGNTSDWSGWSQFTIILT